MSSKIDKIEEIKNEALNLIKNYKHYNNTYNRLKNDGELDKIISFCYVPVSKHTMNKLVGLKLEADLLIDDEKNVDSFYHTMKLVKPNYVITSFKEKIVKRYQLITNRETLISYIEGEYERRVNAIRLYNLEYMENNELTDEFKAKLISEQNDRFDEAKLVVTDIKANPSKYEYVITTAEQNLSYPALYIKYEDETGKKHQYDEHLREENIPNVFAYEAAEVTAYASNKKVKNLIAKGAKYYLDTILVLKKGN